MMPCDAFWAPITASRYLLSFVNGNDDLFRSGMIDTELCDRLERVGGETRLHLLASISKKDEYVPESADKDNL